MDATSAINSLGYRRSEGVACVWFEGRRGIISLGELHRGRVGSFERNMIYCTRFRQWFSNCCNWQTRAQYDSLVARGKTTRARNGSIHKEPRG